MERTVTLAVSYFVSGSAPLHAHKYTHTHKAARRDKGPCCGAGLYATCGSVSVSCVYCMSVLVCVRVCVKHNAVQQNT